MSWVWAALMITLAGFFLYLNWLHRRLVHLEAAVARVARSRERNAPARAEGEE